MYGRESAGHSSTRAMNQPADDDHRADRGEQLQSRVRSRGGPATR